jgi:hypothetical protein
VRVLTNNYFAFYPNNIGHNYYPNLTNTKNTCLSIINFSLQISQFYLTAIPDRKEMSYLNVQDRIQVRDMHQTIHNTKQSVNHCVTVFIRK